MQIEPIASCEATPSRADFTADLVQLESAVSYLARRVIERRNSIPILSNIVIEARPCGAVILTATDFDMWASFTVTGEVESPGRFTVPGQALADKLAKGRKTKDAGSRVRLVEREARAEVGFSRNRYNLPMLPADDFPLPPICDDTLSHAFTVPAGRFLADLAALAPCESTREQHYYLNGTALQVRELAGQARLVAVATDGANMAVASRALPDGAADLPDMIIPRGTGEALRRAAKLATGEALRIERHEIGRNEWVSLEWGALRIDSKLIAGYFPDWQADAVWQRAAPTGEGAALFPELLPGAPVKALADMAKAAGGDVAWQDGKHALLGAVAGDDGLALLASKAPGGGCGSKGFEYGMNGHEEARAYLLALAEARGLPLPDDMKARAAEAEAEAHVYYVSPVRVQVIADGLTVRGLTVSGEVHRRAWTETVQDWEALVERQVYHAGGAEPLEGSYSILMPAEGPALEYASEIIGPEGVAYPVAMNETGIHLSKDQVRALAGEADTRTVEVQTADGRTAHVHAVAWEGPGRFLCICKPNGRDMERGIGSAMYVDREAVVWTSAGDMQASPIADALPAAPEPVQAQEEARAPDVDSREALDALHGAPAGEFEAVELVSESYKLPDAPADDPEPATVNDGLTVPGADLADKLAVIMARLDAVEAALSAKAPEPESAAPIAEQAPAARPARSPAHERAIRRAWAERKARRHAATQLRIGQGQFDALTAERDRLQHKVDSQRENWQALHDRTIARLHREQDKRRRSTRRARLMLADVRQDRNRARKHAATWEKLARGQFTKRAAMEKTQLAAEQRADAARAEIAKLKQSLADPTQPERASDIARLLAERDQARTSLAAVSARAERQQAALDQAAEQLETMGLRMAKAEAALRKAGLIAA